MVFRQARTPWDIMVLAVILLLVCSEVLAAGVTAKLDRNTAVVGETVTLVLETSDTNQSLDADFSVLQTDFDVLNRRSETQMAFVNGTQTASVRLVITLEPKHEGELVIPALKFPGASSNPLTLKVAAAPALAPGEAEPVFIEVTVQPEEGPYYVLSQISLTVRIFYQANLTEAAINPPSPAQASVRLLDEVPYQSDRNGERY
ncbi:MAG: BatD family protein, partial [Lysobacterales bacterium]